jgi:hypothetical protein
MTVKSQYRWPTKLKKFGISDPFLKILATKYEKEIPWQVEVRCPDSLKRHVEKVMLPRLLAKTHLPDDGTVNNHLYVTTRDVSLDAAIEAENDHESSELETIEIIRMVEGDASAITALVKFLNDRKFNAFKAWIDLLAEKYPDQPAFRLLLLRPIFELSGRGIRRTVIEPSLDIIDWLHRRIERERILPDVNMATQYCLKQGMGFHPEAVNGWQFIRSGIQNAPQLSAASFGSGWCIAEHRFANRYLEHFDFYILRSNHQPVVALRISPELGKIFECRGRSNSQPKQWSEDIGVFILTQGFKYDQITDYGIYIELAEFLNDPVNLENQSESWWKERAKLWPFALELAPLDIKNKLTSQFTVGTFQYANFKNFRTLTNELAINLDQDYWRMMLEIYPQSYRSCPQDLQTNPSIQEACIAGWTSLLEDDEITTESLKSAPEFVRSNPAFKTALEENFLPALHAAIRKSANTWHERANRFRMQEVLPATQGESAKIACERLVNLLLINEDGIYSDEKFSDIDRQREDFPAIREQAWFEAFQVHPPLWFALPADLRIHEKFRLNNEVSGKIDLDEWCQKVIQKPWLLTQQKGVPKSIRFHQRMIEAYREGWLPHLRKYPWRLWVSIYPRRVYMSYALLTNDKILAALTDGWTQTKRKITRYWLEDTSERMRNIPAIQLTVLRALGPPKTVDPYPDAFKICLDIQDRRKNSITPLLASSPAESGISYLLKSRGFR